MPPPSPPSWFTSKAIQFGLNRLLLAVALLAVLLAWCKAFWDVFEVPRNFIPLTEFQFVYLFATTYAVTAAVLYSRSLAGATNCLCMLTVAWLTAFMDAVHGTISSFSVMNTPPWIRYYHEMYVEFVRTCTLPLLGTIVVLLVGNIRLISTSGSRYFLLAAVLIALIDIITYATFSRIIFQSI